MEHGTARGTARGRSGGMARQFGGVVCSELEGGPPPPTQGKQAAAQPQAPNFGALDQSQQRTRCSVDDPPSPQPAWLLSPGTRPPHAHAPRSERPSGSSRGMSSLSVSASVARPYRRPTGTIQLRTCSGGIGRGGGSSVVHRRRLDTNQQTPSRVQRSGRWADSKGEGLRLAQGPDQAPGSPLLKRQACTQPCTVTAWPRPAIQRLPAPSWQPLRIGVALTRCPARPQPPTSSVVAWRDSASCARERFSTSRISGSSPTVEMVTWQRASRVVWYGAQGGVTVTRGAQEGGLRGGEIVAAALPGQGRVHANLLVP